MSSSKLSRFLLNLGSLAGFFFAFMIGILLTYLWIDSNVLSPIDEEDKSQKPFIIEKGWNIKTISDNLEEQGVVKNGWAVYYLSRLSKKTENDQLKILPGEYLVSRSQSPKEVLDKILSGDIVYHEVRLVEGYTIAQLPALIAHTTLASETEVLSTLRDREFLARLGVPSNTLEGYLFPETYKFARPETVQRMLARIYNEGKKRIPQEFYQRAVDLGFTFHQILTLASVIEKETGQANERSLIASVFHNRLRIGMPLQSDPTVIYGIKNFNGNITKADLSRPGPYNTYLNTGLPPTPICNPGLEAIRAALYPEDTEFLYFVSKNDGSHQFSATYKEHRKAVNKYQRRRRGKAKPKKVKKPKKPEPKPVEVEKPKTKKKVTKPKPKKKAKKEKSRRWKPLSQIDPVKPREGGEEDQDPKSRKRSPKVVDPADVLRELGQEID